jgi:hypothetical protein
LLIRLLRRTSPKVAGSIVVLAVLGASLTFVFTDSDDRSRWIALPIGAIGLLAILGYVVVVLTIWLNDDQREPGRQR